MSWQLQSIQIVWFASTLNLPEAQDIYTLVAGRDPDTYQVNRSTAQSGGVMSQASGEVDGMTTTVVLHPGRISMHVAPVPQLVEVTQPFLSIDLHQAIAFTGKASALVSQNIPSIIRNAMVANVQKPVASYAEAATLIFEMAQCQLPVDSLSDLEFQLNRRASLGDGLLVNRLLRFNIMGIELHVTVPGQSQTSAPGFGSPIEDKFAVSLAIDLNNVPDRGTLSQETQKRLFSFYQSEFQRLIADEQPLARLWDPVQ